ncbi:hypothetical protein Tco_0220648 [Tanacetum coccineum]
MLKKDLEAISDVVYHTLKKVVPPMVDKTTNDIVKKNFPKVVVEAIRLETKKVKDDIAAIVDDAVKRERESIRDKLYVQIKFKKPALHVEPCRVVVVRTCDHEDHHDDDAR